MAGVIQKSGWIKAENADGYMKYIAQREGVERIMHNGLSTTEQQKLINKILVDYPEAKNLCEYRAYKETPNKKNASEFLSLAIGCFAIGSQKQEVYMKYIATRPRVEMHEGHGLFGLERDLDLAKTLEQLHQHKGDVRTVIYSLQREDAIRLGLDNADSWRELLLRHHSDFAETLHVRDDQLKWYAAFHDEGHHPHIHMMMWADGASGFVSKENLLKMRSILTNDIFKDELESLYVRKDQSYKNLIEKSKIQLRAEIQKIPTGQCSDETKQKLMELAEMLNNVQGKKQYGYLPKKIKDKVNSIVDDLERIPEVASAYAGWNSVRDELERYYKDKEREHLPLRDQKEFKAIKNQIIRAALEVESETMEAEPVAEQEHSEEKHQTSLEPQISIEKALDDLLLQLSKVFKRAMPVPDSPIGMRNASRRKKTITARKKMSKIVEQEQMDYSGYLSQKGGF